MRIADLKIDDVIRFQQATPDFSFDNLAIVDNIYSHYDGKMKWYAELEMMNGNKVTIDDTYDFCKVKEPFTRKVDMINQPPHYTYGEIEIIDFIEQVTAQYSPELAFAIGSAIKYIARSPHKNGKEDIAKAKWYIERAFEQWEG